MKKEVIAYLGAFEFPYGQAASKRVMGNVKLLQDLGYRVLVGHGGSVEKEIFQASDTSIESFGLGELFNGEGPVSKLIKHMFRSGDNTINWLKSLDTKPDYVIVYGGYYRYASKILKYCKANDIKIIFDIVEWYEPNQMLGGRYGFFYNSFLLAFKFVYPKADGIIAISSNLQKVFTKNTAVVVPPLVATSLEETVVKSEDALSLIYAGNIGNKDHLIEIIEVVEKLSIDHKIVFNICGPSEGELKAKYNVEKFSDAIKVHGKIKQQEINDYIKKADFTVFIRPDTHCNRYGFPSKYVESLSLGVPVATNLTSDIGVTLQDGFNGFVIEEGSSEAIESSIKKMLNLSLESKQLMRKNALKTANECFSSHSSSLQSNLRDFFSKVDSDCSVGPINEEK